MMNNDFYLLQPQHKKFYNQIGESAFSDPRKPLLRR